MSRLPKPSAVLFVANVPNMTAFYRTLASMALLHDAAGHAILEIDGFQLVIHALRGAPDAAAAPVGKVPAREDTYIKLCFPVESIAAARSRAAALGGTIQPASSEWEARGFRACDGCDPEGNVFQVRQTAAGTS